MWNSEYKLLCLYRASSSDSKPEVGASSSKAAAVSGTKRPLEFESPPGRAKFLKDDALSPGSTSMGEAPSSDRDPLDSPLNIETLLEMFDDMSLKSIQSPYTQILPKLRGILRAGPKPISEVNFVYGALFVLTSRNQVLYAYIRKITEYRKEAYAEVCLIKYSHKVYDAWISDVNKRLDMKITKAWRQNYRPVYWRPLGDEESNTGEQLPMSSDELEVLKYWLSRGFLHLPPAIELLLFSDPKFNFL